MKKLIKLALLLVILLVAALVGAVLYIDSIARTGIEKGATYALGVDTKLDKASIGLFSGKFGLSGLEVANPAGFKAPHFLSLGDGSLAVSLGSLNSDKIEVPSFKLSKLDVHLEKVNDKANYQVILDNLKKFESKEEKPAEPAKEGKRYIVKEVVIENVVIHIDLLPIGGDLTKIDLKIPSITLKDVGSESDKGVLMGELSNVLVQAVLQAAVEKGAGIIPPDILNGLDGGLKQLKDLDKMAGQLAAGAVSEVQKQVGGVMKDVTGELDKALGGATKDLGKGADDLLKGVGGLLDKDKKK